MRRTLTAVAAALFVTVLGCQMVTEKAPLPEPEGPGLKEEMRLPWAPKTSDCIRKWLVCGTFPSPEAKLQAGADRRPRGEGHDTDYLGAVGGEAAVRPTAGQEVARPDGSEAAWTPYESPEDTVDLLAVFAGQDPLTWVVAYAYTTVDRDEAGDAFLALGSDDSVKVWVNGELVHDRIIARAVGKDEDVVPVTFRKGENHLLLKVENNAGGWGLVVRVVASRESVVSGAPGLRLQSVKWPARDTTEMIVLRTDSDPGAAAPAPVVVEARAPGGGVLARAESLRGQDVSMDAADWPDGPYELRAISPTPYGRPVVGYLDWYKGDWLAHVRELLDAADGVSPDSDDPGDLRLPILAEIVLATLDADPREESDEEATPSAPDGILSPLMEHSEIQAEPTSGAAKLDFLRLAWRDEVDGSAQFARVYLPFDYDPAVKWPMVVSLHGYYGENPRYIHWWGVWGRHHGVADRNGVIVVEPHGRGNTSYLGIGDADVLRAISRAEAAFNVDDDRVYLMGYSMGGGGTWHVGTRHPELFAAIAPVYGGWDYHVWLPEEVLRELTPRERFMMEAESSFVQAEALLTTPVLVSHGDADQSVDVNQSRYAVRMLQRWGYPMRYWEVPGVGHSSLGNDHDIVRWFLQRRLERNPRRVRVRAAHLKDASAHWVRVERRDDPWALIHVDARVANPRLIVVGTENVLEITLSPSAELVGRENPVRVAWNERSAGEHSFADGSVTLRAPGHEPGPLRKRPELAGPCGDLQTTPFAVVVGTASEDPAMREFCRRHAERFRDAWQGWQHADPRIFLDSEITEEQIRRYSLALLGGPKENLVTRRLADRIPLRVEPDAVTVAGQRFEGQDLAVTMVYPHPLNPGRYVVVGAATSPAGMFHASLLPEHYDFAITDGRAQGGDVGFEDVCVAAGFFDAGWQYVEGFTLRGDPDLREAAPIRKPPRLMSADQPGERLMLSELIEARTTGTFGDMVRDASATGAPLRLAGRTYESGIGVQFWGDAPCAVEYDLGDAGWKRLRATIGIEVDEPGKLTDAQKAATDLRFIVRGDGEELYRSPAFGADSKPVEMDVDVTGVQKLELQVTGSVPWGDGPVPWAHGASSLDWADLRLER